MNEVWCRKILGHVAYNGPMPKDYTAVGLAFHWVYHHVVDAPGWYEEFVIRPHKAHIANRGKLDIGATRPADDGRTQSWDKPRGFSGDGDLLQKLYDCHGQGDRVMSLWDHYLAARPETLSLQHRRQMFEENLETFINKGARSLIDLGSGNGSYADHALHRLLQRTGDGRVVGIDSDMLPAYPWGRRPLFIRGNVLRDLPDSQFDIVYSGGLFDYFNDKVFIHMLGKIQALKPKFVMIGNIEQSVQTKAMMGCMNWELFDRSRWDLLQLTINTFAGCDVDVITDLTGHQHFLMVKL